MRWFSGDPNIHSRPMKPIQREWRCPIEDCAGRMEATGEAWCTNTLGYYHTCTVCGYAAVLRGKKYPHIDYEIDYDEET